MCEPSTSASVMMMMRIPHLLGIEVLAANPGAERGDHRLDLVAAQHLVESRFFDVQDLAFDREDCLESTIAPLLGRAAGRLTFDDVDLTQRGVALLAVRELAGKTASVKGALPAHEIPGFPSSFTCPGRIDRFTDDPLGDGGILFEKLAQLVVDDCFDDPFDLGVAKLGLGLTFELRPRDLDADDAGEPLADVVAADARVLEILREIVLDRIGVDRPGERGPEP